MNKYLIKIASKETDKTPNRAATMVGAGVSSYLSSNGIASILGYNAHKNMHKRTGVTYRDVAEYTKAKNLRHVKQFRSRYADNSFMPGYKGFVLGDRPTASFTNPDAGMHEMGHAHSFNGARKYKLVAPKFGLHTASMRLGMGGAGVLIGATAGSSKNEKVRKAAPYVMGAIAAPTLVEEAKASLSPYMHLRKTRGSKIANKFLRKIAPAYGTYVAIAGGSVGAAVLAKRMTERKVKHEPVPN